DRLRQLRDERAAAERVNNHKELERIDQETEGIETYLTKGTGLGGRTRTFSDARKKAVNSVGQALRRALTNIELKDAAWATHLRNSLKIGGTCFYQAEKPLLWD